MSESDTTVSGPGPATTGSTSTAPGVDPPTQELFIGDGGAGSHDGGSGDSTGEAGNADDDWPVRGPRKGIRMSVPTVALLALLIAAGGIWGGAALQRSHGTTSGTSSAASSLAAAFRSRLGGTGGGFPGAATTTPATAGTVTEVSGSTLYVTNATGGLVKVTVGPSVTVTRNAKTALAGLQVGDTVVVEGTKAGSGSVTASSVTATGPGVTTGFAGRFGAAGG